MTIHSVTDIPEEQLDTVRSQLMQNIEIDEGTDCWWWKGPVDDHKYGRIRIPIVQAPGYAWVSTHKLAYVLAVEDVSSSHYLQRVCGNPMCCNPKHLIMTKKKRG